MILDEFTMQRTPKDDRLTSIFAARLLPKCSVLKKIFAKPASFWIAGGAMIKDSTDIDIFIPANVKIEGIIGDEYIVSQTANATTYVVDGQTVQICRYTKNTLKELVESFDYAHTQIGCAVEYDPDYINIKEVYFTKEFEASRIAGASWFINSDYPLSSLIRSQKFYAQGLLNRGSGISAVISCLIKIIERGFKDYADFKDQIDAIDLGLLPDDFEEIGRNDLSKLFELLKR